MDAFLCNECPSPSAVISSDSLDFKSDFVCESCEAVFERTQMQQMEDSFAEIVEDADKNDNELLEQLLEMCLEKFHPRNYLSIMLKRHLIYIYGKKLVFEKSY